MKELCGDTRGATVKIRNPLELKHPSVLKNVIFKLNEESNAAQELIDCLVNMKKIGKVEYLKVFLHPKTNILEGVVWNFKGAKSVVERCNDLLMWDSTHNATKFLYRLASFVLIDSEFHNRPVLFSLALKETADSCKRVLTCWHNAFKTRIPSVVFTDGDDSMHVALSSVPYSTDIHHLLCLFHLFDTNFKKKLMPVLQKQGPGASSQWDLFRRGLSQVREPRDEHEFERIWNYLIEEWILNVGQGQYIRRYAEIFVYNTRRQWATCFFTNAFTLGQTTTQRVESWKKQIKEGAKGFSTVQLAEYIENICSRHRELEIIKSSSQIITNCFSRVPIVHNSELLHDIIGLGISKYAAHQLAGEISKAGIVTFDRKNPLRVELKGVDTSGRKKIIASETAQYMYTLQETNSTTGSHTAVSITLESCNGSVTTCVKCECKYYHRVRIPCRHVLMTGLHIDRNSDLIKKLKSMMNGDSFLLFLMRNTISTRWKVPKTKELSNNILIPIQEAKERREVFPCPNEDVFAWHSSGGFELEEEVSQATKVPDPRVSFVQLRSTLTSLTDMVTKTSENQRNIKLMHSFFHNLHDEISRASGSDLKVQLENAIDLTFGPNCAE